MKETVMQFGEGGFLRGFVDWMFDKMNKQGLYDGSVVIVQPIKKCMCDMLSAQDCKYTQLLRGIENGEVVVQEDKIECISRCINPYTDFAGYLELAKKPDLRVIVSNTTESGIAYNDGDKLTDAPPKSFPAKLTVFLYDRFKLGFGDMIYRQAVGYTQGGEPIVCALNVRYPNDKATFDIDDQFVLCSNILVAPVVNQSQTRRNVYLPEGDWYDPWSKKIYSGSQILEIKTPLHILPFFINEQLIEENGCSKTELYKDINNIINTIQNLNKRRILCVFVKFI